MPTFQARASRYAVSRLSSAAGAGLLQADSPPNYFILLWCTKKGTTELFSHIFCRALCLHHARLPTCVRASVLQVYDSTNKQKVEELVGASKESLEKMVQKYA